MRAVLTAAITLATWCVASPASAQDAPTTTSIQVEHFEPLPSQGTNVLNIGKSDVLPHLSPSGGVFLHYVNTPLRLIDPETGDVASNIIRHQVKSELWGSFGLFDIAELGVVLPVVVFQGGEDLAALGRPGQDISSFAVADARLVPKVRLPIDPEKLAGFGAALIAPVYIPIGDSESFNSDGTVRWEPRLVVDWRHPVGIAVAANVGYQLRPTQQTRNIVSDDVVRYGLGVELPTGLENFQVIGSFFGSVPTAGDPDPQTIGEELENNANPREALGGLQYKLPYNLVANLGAGAGISSGIGSPRLRVFGSIGYTPQVRDSDDDGLLDEEDGCPREPEDEDGFEDSDGCPDLDNDRDKVLDTDDACPNEPEDADGFEDEDGCPDPDNDKDGIPDAEDECPDTAGVAKKNGCPFNDKDSDGIEDTKDLCPNEPEDTDGFEDEDGCPDLDNDGDGIEDIADECPDKAEDVDEFQDTTAAPTRQ